MKGDAKTRAEITELANTLRDNLNKIVQHGKRADSIVKNMLLHSREGSGEHRPATSTPSSRRRSILLIMVRGRKSRGSISRLSEVFNNPQQRRPITHLTGAEADLF
jgi:hypothetical protein